MSKIVKRGIINFLLMIGVYTPVIFYLVYTSTNSIALSLIGIVLSYFVWRRLFNVGVRKQKKDVDELLAKKFPVSEEDPFLDPDRIFAKGWVKGIGATNGLGQPMFVKASIDGVSLLYICRASENTFIVPWESISQINQLGKSTDANHELVRLFVLGVGMEVIVPWEDKFNQFIPERVAFG